MLTGSELGAAIESARQRKKISKKALAERFGVKPPSVQGWVKTGRIDKATLIGLIEFFSDCVQPSHWGLSGKTAEILLEPGFIDGEFERVGEPPEIPALLREAPSHYGAAGLSSNVAGGRIEVQTRSVPVVGKAMLGPDGYFDAMDYPTGHGEGLLNVVSRDGNAYGLRVVGHSMAPRIKHNEFVLIEPNHSYTAGDEVLVKTVKGQAMIKSFAYLRDGQYRFDSINAEYAPVMLDEGDVEFIHYVGAIVKSSMFMVTE